MALDPYAGVTGLIAWNSFEGGTDGAAVTAGNSGGASGTAFSAVQLGGSSTVNYKAAGALDTMAMEVIGNAGIGMARWDSPVVGSQTNLYGVAYVTWAAFPTGYTTFVEVKQSDGGALAYRLKISSSGNLRLSDALDATVFSTAAPLSTGTRYRIEWHVNSTTGFYEVWWYLGDSTTPIDSRTNTVAGAFGTVQAQVNFGRTASPDHVTVYDNIGLATTKLGPRALAGTTALPASEVSNAGSWTATGGTSVAVLRDASDSTYIASPDSPSPAKAIRFKLEPLSVTEVVTVTTRDAKNNTTQNIERTVTIYNGATNVGSSVFALSTTITNHQTVTSAPVTAGVQLEVVISDVVV